MTKLPLEPWDGVEDTDGRQGTDFLKRLGHHAPRFMLKPWPKNVLSLLCREVLRLRADVAELKRKTEGG